MQLVVGQGGARLVLVLIPAPEADAGAVLRCADELDTGGFEVLAKCIEVTFSRFRHTWGGFVAFERCYADLRRFGDVLHMKTKSGTCGLYLLRSDLHLLI